MRTSIQNAEAATDQELVQINTEVKHFNPLVKLKNKLALYTGLSVLGKNELEIFALILKRAQQQKSTVPVELIQKYVLTKTHCGTLEEKKQILFKKTVSTLKKISSVNFSLLLDQDDTTEVFSFVPSMFNIVNVYKDKETGCLSKIEFDFNIKFWSLIDPCFVNNNNNYMHVNIEHLSALTSKYAQRLYLLFSTYRYSEYKGLAGQLEGQGIVLIKMSLEKSSEKMPCLREFLCIPSTYKVSAFKNQIIEPALKQIKRLSDINDIRAYRHELETNGCSKENIEANIDEEKRKGSLGMFLDLKANFLAKPHSKSYGGVEFSFIYKNPQLSLIEQVRLWNERNGGPKAQKGTLIDEQGNPRAEEADPRILEYQKVIETLQKKLQAEKDKNEANKKILKYLSKAEESLGDKLDNTDPLGLNNVPRGYKPPKAE